MSEEIRCKKCNRLLLKANGNMSANGDGMFVDVEVKCPKCGYTCTFNIMNKLKKGLDANKEYTLKELMLN